MTEFDDFLLLSFVRAQIRLLRTREFDALPFGGSALLVRNFDFGVFNFFIFADDQFYVLNNIVFFLFRYLARLVAARRVRGKLLSPDQGLKLGNESRLKLLDLRFPRAHRTNKSRALTP
jgi:hypothetical protein